MYIKFTMNELMGKNDDGNTKPDFNSLTAVIEIKQNLSALRGLRDSLIQVIKLLSQYPEKQGYLLLLNPGIGSANLDDEFEDIRSALLPSIAERLHLIIAKEHAIGVKPKGMNEADWAFVKNWIATLKEPQVALPNPDKKSEVLLFILLQWITDKAPISSRWIERTVGCSYRTVSAAINELGPAIKRESDRRVRLKYFPEESWRRIAAMAQKIRTSMYYVDASDQSRSPESLLKRLNLIGRHDIAIGGVLGAKHHFPNLDIVGTPRLDICLHVPGKSVNLSFIHQLDPALERTRDRHRPARLVLHYIRRKETLFTRGENGFLWADPVECLLNLYDARLDVQAAHFVEFLTAQSEKSNENA